ncbi:MAG: hypothetical protein KGL39_00975 [Patescibacteria group bacterium]|nr:hypothetical protein [Patescibacteria group bacterium]
MAQQYRAPIIIAGDLFDKPHATPATIHFALQQLRDLNVYAVPGQHDLPNHRYELRHQAAYGVLEESGRIINLEPNNPVEVAGPYPLRLWGFPWGIPPEPLKQPFDLFLEIAVVHHHVWTKATGHVGASESGNIKQFAPHLGGYNVVVIGDNHKPFNKTLDVNCLIHNCGGMYRRRSDEQNHRPSVGLLHSPSSPKLPWIERHYLDISQDRFVDVGKILTEVGIDKGSIEDFISELSHLQDIPIDFVEAIHHHLDSENVNREVREMMLGALLDSRTRT